MDGLMFRHIPMSVTFKNSPIGRPQHKSPNMCACAAGVGVGVGAGVGGWVLVGGWVGRRACLCLRAVKCMPYECLTFSSILYLSFKRKTLPRLNCRNAEACSIGAIRKPQVGDLH